MSKAADVRATRSQHHRMVRGKGFKIHCAYVYPWLESTKTYRTKEQARKDLRKWQREAADQGQEIIGRIAPNALISRRNPPHDDASR